MEHVEQPGQLNDDQNAGRSFEQMRGLAHDYVKTRALYEMAKIKIKSLDQIMGDDLLAQITPTIVRQQFLEWLQRLLRLAIQGCAAIGSRSNRLRAE